MPTIDDQLTSYLTDAHAIEEQALAQLRPAPELAGDEELGHLFAEHLAETEEHERMVRGRLEARGAKPSKVEDLAMAAGGKGFATFARSQPDTAGKLISHAFSYEALEQASYELLARVADIAGDAETARTARTIRDQETGMIDRLEGAFDRSVETSLAQADGTPLSDTLDRYLQDAHGLEAQAIQLLEESVDLAGDQELRSAYAEHLTASREHAARLEERLDAHGASTSKVKDAALGVGGRQWAAFFAAHPDTPGKVAAFVYAFQHLKIAGYEQLGRVARRAGDEETVQVLLPILREERSAAERVAGLFDQAIRASLEARETESDHRIPQPIKARAHGIMDYGFVGLMTTVPSLLGLSGRARAVAAGFGAVQGVVNALTDTRVGVKPVITLRTHGWLEAASGPAFVGVPYALGVLEDRRARAFFGGALAALVTAYTLTDWKAPADS